MWAFATCDLANRMYLYINNKPFIFGYESKDGSGSACIVPVRKGDKIIISANQERKLYFVPYK